MPENIIDEWMKGVLNAIFK